MDVETEMTLAKLRAEIDELRSRLDAVEDEAADAAEGAEVGGDAEVRGSGQWDLPDADACAAGFTGATRSVETVPSTGLRQIYKFAGGGHAVTVVDLTAHPPPDPPPVFLMRKKVYEGGANALSVAYCTLQTLKDALGGGSESSGGGSGSGTSGPWWELGGNAATCYGYAIGNALAEKVIDLVEKALVGDWSVDGDLLVDGKATMTDGAATILANPSLMDADNQMQPRQVTFFVPGTASGKLQPFKAWVMASAGADYGSEQDLTPAADGLPDETWIWGRVAYDSTYNKFVQYKLVWSAATRTFAESATATDIIVLDSHSSQHV